MPSRIQQNPDAVLRLMVGQRGSQCEGIRDGGVEISDLEVENLPELAKRFKAEQAEIARRRTAGERTKWVETM